MKIFTLALPVLALSALFPAKSGAAVHGVSLHVSSAAKVYTSGAVMPVRAYFRNQAKLPLTFCQFRSAPEYTFLCRGTYGPHAAQVAPTAFGSEAVRPWSSNGFSFTPIGLIAPGNSGDYRHPIPVGQYLDTTLPGRYIVRVTTKYGLRVGIPGPLWSTKREQMIFLVQDGDRSATQRRIGRNVLVSQPLRITVLAPYRQIPAAPLGPPVKVVPRANATGIRVLLINADAKGPGPITIDAEYANYGRSRLRLRLTGNPFVDFKAIQVQGPSSLDRVRHVRAPKPHEVVTRVAVPAITAYGRWLAKHPVPGLKRKAYTLKPGLVYKYAEPINLSCMYDMTLAGVYRVRVELAHTHTWSPWANVTVPQYY